MRINLIVVLLASVLSLVVASVSSFVAGSAGAEDVTTVSTIERSVKGRVWSADGWTFIHAAGDPVVEAISPTGDSIWLDVAPLTDGKRAVDSVTRVGDRFVATGLTGTRSSEIATAMLVLNDRGRVVEHHSLGVFARNGRSEPAPEVIQVLHAHGVGEHEIALFWTGYRLPGKLQLGVSLFNSTSWKLVRDIYGPIDLPAVVRGEVSFRDSLCQMRTIGDSLVVVDAHNASLAIFDIGEQSTRILPLRDDLGQKAAVTGWWVARGSEGEPEVQIVYLSPAEDDMGLRRYSMRLDGTVGPRRPFAATFRALFPAETGTALMVRSPGLIERVTIQ